jgi:uncharacterized membrane protein HdeD (DUF308 family)
MSADSADSVATGSPMSHAASWEVLIGVVSVLAGLLVLLLPDRTLLLVAVVVGVQLVVVGLMRPWAIRAFALPARVRLLGGGLAIAMVVAGVVCMLRPGASLLLVAIMIGAGWLADGVIEIVAFATGAATDRWSALLSGAVALVGGILVLVFPRSTLTVLAQVSGAVLLTLGLAYALAGLRRWRAPLA